MRVEILKEYYGCGIYVNYYAIVDKESGKVVAKINGNSEAHEAEIANKLRLAFSLLEKEQSR